MNVGRGGVKICWLSYCQWLFDYPNHRLSTIHLFLSLSWSIINVLHWSIIMYQDLYLIWGTVASIYSHWFKIFTVITSKLPCEEQIYSMNDYMYLQMAYCKIMHCILTKLDLKSWYHACITEFEGWYAKTLSEINKIVWKKWMSPDTCSILAKDSLIYILSVLVLFFE